jgi:hypothetical protein
MLRSPIRPFRPASFLVLLVALGGAEASAQWLENNWITKAQSPADQGGDLFGWRVRAMGDVDDDGIGDFAVAAPFHDLNQGRVAVFSGATGAEIWARESSTTSEILGFELATIQDLDGDGARELVSSGPFAGNGGRVYVDSGATGANLHTFSGFNHQRLLGASLATGGDYDGDGVDDLALGDLGYSGGIGRVFVHSGVDFGLIARLDAPLPTDARFGVASTFTGDLDGDARDELVIGVRLSGDAPPGRLEVFGFDGADPVLLSTISGVDLSCALCGDHLDGGRDVDADGIPDLFLGEDLLSRARVFSGADGSTLETVSHTKAGTLFGNDVDAMGDLNGDGYPEVVASASDEALVVSRCNASWQLYGAGFAGTVGVPSIALAGAPVLGASVTLDLGSSLPTTTVGVLLIGLDDAALLLPAGGTVLVAPDLVLALSIPATGVAVTGTLPVDDALCGVPLHLQGIELDAGAPGNLSLTDGLRAFLGR